MKDHLIDTSITTFIGRLRNLDPGDRSRLRRNAGRKLAEAHNATALFYHLLPSKVPESQEEVFFLLATLYPLADETQSGDLGTSLRRAQNQKNKKGLDRRVEILLDADLEQLPFRLRQALHFLQSNRVSLNFSGLLADLLAWNHPEHYVQKKWARSYFASTDPS